MFKKVLAIALVGAISIGGLAVPALPAFAASAPVSVPGAEEDICNQILYYLKKDARIRGVLETTTHSFTKTLNCDLGKPSSGTLKLGDNSSKFYDGNISSDKLSYKAGLSGQLVSSRGKDASTGVVPVCVRDNRASFGSLFSGSSHYLLARDGFLSVENSSSFNNTWLNCAPEDRYLLQYIFSGKLLKGQFIAMQEHISVVGTSAKSASRKLYQNYSWDANPDVIHSDWKDAWLPASGSKSNLFAFTSKEGGIVSPGLGVHTPVGDLLIIQTYNDSTNTYVYKLEFRNVNPNFKAYIESIMAKESATAAYNAWNVYQQTYLPAYDLLMNSNYRAGGFKIDPDRGFVGLDYALFGLFYDNGSPACGSLSASDYNKYDGSYAPLSVSLADSLIGVSGNFGCSWSIPAWTGDNSEAYGKLYFEANSHTGIYIAEGSQYINAKITEQDVVYVDFRMPVVPYSPDVLYTLWKSPGMASVVDKGKEKGAIKKESEEFFEGAGYENSFNNIWNNITEGNKNTWNEITNNITTKHENQERINESKKNELDAICDANNFEFHCVMNRLLLSGSEFLFNVVGKGIDFIGGVIEFGFKSLINVIGGLFSAFIPDGNFFTDVGLWFNSFSPFPFVKDIFDTVASEGNNLVASSDLARGPSLASGSGEMLIDDVGSPSGSSVCRSPVFEAPEDSLFKGLKFDLCSFNAPGINWALWRNLISFGIIFSTLLIAINILMGITSLKGYINRPSVYGKNSGE